MADPPEVPPTPLVHVGIDQDGLVSINGYDVPHDGRIDPRQLALEVVCGDFAQPLGRPVRALVIDPQHQTRMVIHPDGRVTDVAPHRPATPEGVPPATRAQGWLAARDADRAAAEASAARHAGRRRHSWRNRYPDVVVVAAVVVAAAALVWSQRGPTAEEPVASDLAVADSGQTLPNNAAPPAQTLLESTRLQPLAVSGVAADAEPGAIRLTVAATRRTPVRVVVTPVDRPAAARHLSLAIRGAADRVVTVPGLAAGSYRWQVIVPGQRTQTGMLQVPAEPPVQVELVPVVDDVPDESDDIVTAPAPTPAPTATPTPTPTPAPGPAPAPAPGGGDGGGGNGGDDGGGGNGGGPPPPSPVDPDGD